MGIDLRLTVHQMGSLTARVLYMHHPTDRITHTTAFVTPVMEHWLEQEIQMLLQNNLPLKTLKINSIFFHNDEW